MFLPIDHTPVITSVLPSTTVHARLLLANGLVPDVATGQVQIRPHQDHIKTQSITIVAERFTALIPLLPGENEITLLYYSQEAQQPYSSVFYCTYMPLLQNPPLKLVLILGSDSPERYDDVPDCRTPPTLSTAIEKLRLAGYIWAAYTASEMAAAGHGYRTFRLDEAWQQDSLTTGYANTATVHVLRSKYSVAEIRDPDRAQQNHGAGNAGSLFGIALEALHAHSVTNGPREYVAAMFLDAHAEENGLITGHAALGGGTPQHSLAIFGSHSLFAWPARLEDIESCLTDTREVDTRYCGIDAEGKRYFAACTVGVGAMMHEVGHLYGCPHQQSGVMLRDYPRLHRSLTALDPIDADRLVGAGICHWHSLDLLRFLGHPAFRLPLDRAYPADCSISCLPSPEGLHIVAPAGIVAIEFYGNASEFPVNFLDFSASVTTHTTVSLDTVRQRVPSGPIRLSILTHNNKSQSVQNVESLLRPEMIDGRDVWRSPDFGVQNGDAERVLFLDGLTSIVVHSGACLDGLVVHHGTVSQFGKLGGSASTFTLGRNEVLLGVVVRSGQWIDGIQFHTNQRQSEFFGNRHGGEEHTVRCPPGHKICGIAGHTGHWVNSFSVLYTRM